MAYSTYFSYIEIHSLANTYKGLFNIACMEVIKHKLYFMNDERCMNCAADDDDD